MNDPVRTAPEIAQRAAELVGGAREETHGAKRQNFENIAAIWNAYLAIRRDVDAPLDGADVGHMMAGMKLARTQTGSLNIDDYVDGAGYFACAGEVAIGMKADEPDFASMTASEILADSPRRYDVSPEYAS